MTIAVILIPVLVVAFIAIFRNQRDTAHLDRVPFSSGPDAARIHAELLMLTGQEQAVHQIPVRTVPVQSWTKSSNAAANSRTQTARM